MKSGYRPINHKASRPRIVTLRLILAKSVVSSGRDLAWGEWLTDPEEHIVCTRQTDYIPLYFSDERDFSVALSAFYRRACAQAVHA